MTSTVWQGPERRRVERRARGGEPHAGQSARHMAGYGRFAAMIAASTVLGYGATYLNTYALDHVFFSWTRVFMSLIMAGVMTAVMIVFMWSMYPSRRTNAAALGVAGLLVLAGIVLVRSQATVEDVAYMRAMIPHHSIAILTSERADLKDQRVRDLADSIIAAQRSEITEMKRYLADLESP